MEIMEIMIIIAVAVATVEEDRSLPIGKLDFLFLFWYDIQKKKEVKKFK